jgi:hypothetical protein
MDQEDNEWAMGLGPHDWELDELESTKTLSLSPRLFASGRLPGVDALDPSLAFSRKLPVVQSIVVDQHGCQVDMPH